MEMSPKHELAEILLARGAGLVGFADLRAFPAETREGLPRAVAIVAPIDPFVIAGLKTGPTVMYHDEYHRLNNRLNSLAHTAADYLQERGAKAIALPADDIGYDPGTLSVRLPHKTAATRAGLGWIGKCSLLITEPFGSAVRLATVLTDAELPVGPAINESRCDEDCFACTHACPAEAPSGESWHAGRPRDTFFNAYICNRTAGHNATKAGFGEVICGLCMTICPWTRRYIERSCD